MRPAKELPPAREHFRETSVFELSFSPSNLWEAMSTAKSARLNDARIARESYKRTL